MKIFFVCLLIVSIIYSSKPVVAQVVLPFEEHFMYNLGNLDQESTEWNRISKPITSTVDIKVVNNNLTYNNYPMPSQGNQLELSSGLAGTGEIIYNYLLFEPVRTENTIYVSFLLNFRNLNDLTSVGSYFAGLNDDDYVNNSGFLRIWARSSGVSSFNLGITKNSDGEEQIAWTPESFNVMTTYLIVVNYSLVVGDFNDIIKMWVNPDLTGIEPEPTLSIGPISPFIDATKIESFYLRQTSELVNINLDAIRISTNWGQSPLPVELSSFSAITKNEQVIIEWKTTTEINNYGFDVERKSFNDWEKISFVFGNGNSNSPKEYLYIDKIPAGGNKFIYRLKQIDNDGAFKYSEEVEVNIAPTNFGLFQNYPNPFNPSTKLRYQLSIRALVTLKIYNILGSEIYVSNTEEKEPGFYEYEFNAETFPSGTYIYKIEAGNFINTKKMILLK